MLWNPSSNIFKAVEKSNTAVAWNIEVLLKTLLVNLRLQMKNLGDNRNSELRNCLSVERPQIEISSFYFLDKLPSLCLFTFSCHTEHAGIWAVILVTVCYPLAGKSCFVAVFMIIVESLSLLTETFYHVGLDLPLIGSKLMITSTGSRTLLLKGHFYSTAHYADLAQ